MIQVELNEAEHDVLLDAVAIALARYLVKGETAEENEWFETLVATGRKLGMEL